MEKSQEGEEEDSWKYDQEIKINKNFPEYKLTGDVYHDAGFDAMMTGIVFTKFVTSVNKSKSLPTMSGI